MNTMTTTTTTIAGSAESASELHRSAKVTFAHVVRSEWTKFRSLRSTVFALLAAVAVFIALGLIIPWANARNITALDRLTFDPLDSTLASGFLVQWAVGVLGVLTISGEYSTGMIRATFSSVPDRQPVLWAKAVVFATAAFVVTLIAAVAAFLGGQAMLSSYHLGVSLSYPGAPRAIIGAAFYVTMIGLLGLALGALVRSTAGAITSLVGILLGLELINSTLPSSWSVHVGRYLAPNALNSLIHGRPNPSEHFLSTIGAVALLCAYVVPLLGLAAVSIMRRDA